MCRGLWGEWVCVLSQWMRYDGYGRVLGGGERSGAFDGCVCDGIVHGLMIDFFFFLLSFLHGIRLLLDLNSYLP